MTCCNGRAGINVAGTGTNGKVKVDSLDTLADFLSSKLSAGAGINFTILNPGGNEELEIAATGVGSTPVNDIFFSLLNQTAFTLSSAPAVPSALAFYVDGIRYTYNIDFTIVGTTLTWLNVDFNMSAGMTCQALYTV